MLVVAILAALVMSAAFAVFIDYGNTQNDRSTFSSLTRAVASRRLPDLSGSVAPSSASAPEDQTDNTTATIISGGAVKASFTVVTQPAGNQEESMAVDGQAMPNNQVHAAARISREPGRLTTRWVLLTAVCLAGIAATGVVSSASGRGSSTIRRQRRLDMHLDTGHSCPSLLRPHGRAMTQKGTPSFPGQTSTAVRPPVGADP